MTRSNNGSRLLRQSTSEHRSTPMNRIATISIDLRLNDGVTAAIDDLIEVSLDCSDCKRKMRTVAFREGENHGVCTPSGHWFRGVMLDKRLPSRETRLNAEYDVEYQYEPFIDAKYPDSLQYYGPSEGMPTWARVHFTLNCPRCRTLVPRTTQSNLVRPCTGSCKCGFALYTDEAPPALSWRRA